jgi:nucleotide-binding universal stress UspA family protein
MRHALAGSSAAVFSSYHGQRTGRTMQVSAEATGRPVVVGIDGSDGSMNALDWAATQARRQSSLLRIVLASGSNRADAIGRAVSRVRERRPSVTTSACVAPGYARPALLEESRYASLLVVGRRGAGGFPELRVGSVAFDVSAKAACPVAVVPPWRPVRSADIVIGVDQSDEAQSALAYGFAAASTAGASVRAIYAASRGSGRRDAELLGDAVAVWQEKYPDVRAEADVLVGHPVDVLRTLSQQASLVVVGHRGRGRPLGSTARGTLHYAQSPVAVAS